MSNRKSPLDPWERKALRDYIRGSERSRRSGSEVEDIISLAIASASRYLPSTTRKPDVAACGDAVHANPAFEQRIVALFGD